MAEITGKMTKHYYDEHGEVPLPDSKCLNPDWMKDLLDDTPIWKLSIVGTHDSMTFENSIIPFKKCQQWSLGWQLEAGVRFFDIRYKVERDRIGLHHGIYDLEKELKKNVINVFQTFLIDHSSECIFLRLKDDSTCKHNIVKDFGDIFHDQELAKWLWVNKGDSLPTLGDLRTKIVLLKEFPRAAQTEKYGFEYAGNKLIIADMFNLTSNSYTKKLENCIDNLERCSSQARKENSDVDLKLFLTFTSGTSFVCQSTPYQISEVMNSEMSTYLKSQAGNLESVGIVVMDYPDIELIADIIKVNDKFHKDQQNVPETGATLHGIEDLGPISDDAYVTASDGACEDNDTDCPLSVEGREQLSDLDCKENVNVELNTRQLKNKHEGPSPMLHGVHHTRQTQKTEDDYLSTTDTEASSAFNDNEIQKTQARKIAIELTKPSENLVCEVDTTRIVSLNRPSKLGDEENSMILMERWSNNDRQFSNAGTATRTSSVDILVLYHKKHQERIQTNFSEKAKHPNIKLTFAHIRICQRGGSTQEIFDRVRDCNQIIIMLSRDLSKCEISAYAIEIIEKEKTLRDKVILVKLEECDAPCTIGHLPSVDYHLLNDYLFGEPEISESGFPIFMIKEQPANFMEPHHRDISLPPRIDPIHDIKIQFIVIPDQADHSNYVVKLIGQRAFEYTKTTTLPIPAYELEKFIIYWEKKVEKFKSNRLRGDQFTFWLRLKNPPDVNSMLVHLKFILQNESRQGAVIDSQELTLMTSERPRRIRKKKPQEIQEIPGSLGSEEL